MGHLPHVSNMQVSSGMLQGGALATFHSGVAGTGAQGHTPRCTVSLDGGWTPPSSAPSTVSPPHLTLPGGAVLPNDAQMRPCPPQKRVF